MAKAKPNPMALVSSLKQSSAESRLAALAKSPLFPENEESETNQKPAQRPSTVEISTLATPPESSEGSSVLLDVPIGNIVESAWNARKFYIKSRVDDLSENLKAEGQRVPINAYYDNQGRLVIDDGQYRLRAAKQAGLATLRVQVIAAPASPIDAFKRSRSSNLHRNDQSVLDDAFRLKDLSEALNLSQRTLGKELGYGDADTSKLLALTQLPENIVLTLMTEPALLTRRFLYNLALYFERKGEKETLQLAAQAVEQGMSARELESLLRNAERGYREKPRSERIPLEKGAIKGFVKTFPNGRIELRLDGLEAQEQSIVLEKLRALLQ